MRQDFKDLQKLNQTGGKSTLISGTKGLFLGFLPWSIIEGLRELGDWWAFLDEVEEFERRQIIQSQNLSKPLKFDQSSPKEKNLEKQ